MCICLGHCSYNLLAITHESFKRKSTVPSISGTSDIWQKVSYPIYRTHRPGRWLKAGINKRSLIAQQTEINREKNIAVILKQLQSVFLLAVKCCTVWECNGMVLICITFICHLMTGDLPWAKAKSTFIPQSTPTRLQMQQAKNQLSNSDFLWPRSSAKGPPNPSSDSISNVYT